MTNVRVGTLGILALAAAISPASALTAKLGAGSRVWLEGTSTLHPYESTASQVLLSLVMDPAAPAAGLADGAAAQAPARMTVRIPVAGLKSPHAALDANLRKALKADKYPDIVFAMDGYAVGKGTSPALSAKGSLTVAGVAKPETLEAALSRRGDLLVVDGEQPLLMTDFGIKPPTMMLGAIKTGDKVVVKFHLELEQAADARDAGKN